MTITSNVDKHSSEAPLSALMSMALKTFGDNNFDLADGALAHLLLMFANQVVNDVNSHPYRVGKDVIPYYAHIEDARPIDKMTMIYGMAGYYAMQQASQKGSALMAQYYRTLNQQLWMALEGNTKIEIRPKDAAPTNPTNGQPIEEA